MLECRRVISSAHALTRSRAHVLTRSRAQALTRSRAHALTRSRAHPHRTRSRSRALHTLTLTLTRIARSCVGNCECANVPMCSCKMCGCVSVVSADL